MYSINLGLRNGGGIGDSMQLMELSDPKFFWKLIFDLSYFMLINIVSLNIIFGIIIDTFAELRDSQNTRDVDYTNVCFICGHERDVFEKEGISFDKHVKFEHNPVTYVYFLVYLKEKPKDEFDGNEEYVYNQYKSNKTNWFPIRHTKFIKPDIDEEDFEGQVDNIVDNLDKQTEKAEKIKETAEMLTKYVKHMDRKMKNIHADSRVIRSKTKFLKDVGENSQSDDTMLVQTKGRLQPTIPAKE